MTRWLVLAALVACGGKHADDADRVVISIADRGASLAQLEAEVATPIEAAVAHVEHVAHVRTTIVPGEVKVELHRTGGDPEVEVEDVRAALGGALRTLPASAALPAVTIEPAKPLVMRYTLHTTTLRLDDLAELDSRRVRRELERLPGVVGIETCGAQEPEWRVSLDTPAALQHGVSIGDVVRGIRAANQTMPAGTIDGTTLRTGAPFAAIEDLEAAPIAQRDGRVVTVRDVARVVASSDETGCRASVERGPVVTGAIRMRREADPRAVDDAIERIRTELPAGVTLERFPAASDEILVDGFDTLRIARVVTASPAVAHVLVEADHLGTARLVVAPASGARAATDVLRKLGAIVTPPDAVTVQLGGPDRARLMQLAVAVGGALRARGIALGAGIGLTMQTEVEVTPDRARALDMGVSTADVAEAIRTGTGLEVTTVLRDPPIRVVLEARDRQGLTVSGTNGARVPLDALVTSQETSAASELHREDGAPWVGVTASGDADDIRAAIAAVPLPAGYRVTVR